MRARVPRCSRTGCARISASPCRRGHDVRMSACFRVYDADMPEYCVCDRPLREWRAPCLRAGVRGARNRRRTGGPRAARRGLAVLPEVLALPHERIHLRDAPTPARRERSTRHGRRPGSSTRCARALPLPRQLQRLPRHGPVSRSSPDARPDWRAGQRPALPEPVRLHRHCDRPRGGRRRNGDDDGRHVAHLSRLGAAQPRPERARRSRARIRAGRLPAIGSRTRSDGRRRATA